MPTVVLDPPSKDKPAEDNDNEDHVDTAIRKTGCFPFHEKLQECYIEKKDWRQCANEMKEFRQCMQKVQRTEIANPKKQ